MENKSGTFVVFEGPDGVGKSTQAKFLAATLRKAGGNVWHTSEPTDTAIGRLIRSVLKEHPEIATDWRTMALLFTADRRRHAARIRSALSEGAVVICERYYLSTIVYQTARLWMEYRRHQGDEDEMLQAYMDYVSARDWIWSLCAGLPQPDLTILLDADTVTLSDRLAARVGRDVFERDAPFLDAVAELYRRASIEPITGETIELVHASEPVSHRVMEAFLRSGVRQ